MSFKMPKTTSQLLLGVFVAALSLTACNNKKKSETETTKDTTVQMPDTVIKKPTAPGDLNSPAIDTVVQKPTAPGD